MNRRFDSKSETRKLIVRAAKQLFIEKGPDKCTLREVAQKAGVSAASVVVHFKSKTRLLEFSLYEDIEHNIKHAIETMPKESCPIKWLMHIANTMFRFYNTNRNLYRVLIRDTAFEPVNESPYLTEQTNRYISFFVKMIDLEIERGTIYQDTDSHTTATSLFYLYLFVLLDFLRTPEISINNALLQLENIANQYLRGIIIGSKR